MELTYSRVIFWVSVGILVAILIISITGICYAIKNIRSVRMIVKYVFAGDFIYKKETEGEVVITQEHLKRLNNESLELYKVYGDSLEYSRIKNGDLVFVSKIDVDMLQLNAPKVCVFEVGNSYDIMPVWGVGKSSVMINGAFGSDMFQKLVDAVCISREAVEKQATDIVKAQTGASMLLVSDYNPKTKKVNFYNIPSTGLVGICSYIARQRN